jgi:hypothetical protein
MLSKQGAVGNGSTAETYGPSAPLEAWPTMDNAAYHGIAGDFVRAVGPHSEADPVALLLQFLTAFGSIVGSNAHYQIESDRHRTNLFIILIGISSKARKGTSGGRVRSFCESVDPDWSQERNVSGLSSGEGLISAVRDQVKEWNKKENRYEVTDFGVADKRLLVVEAEFAGTLSVMERSGNTLSPNIRNAWDGLILRTMTKNSPLKATNPHISIVAHVTQDELRARLTRTDCANGFANRFLFTLVKRSKLLPFGGHLDDTVLAPLVERFRLAVEFARRVGRVRMTVEAANGWEKIYPSLSAERLGLLGAITARAETQTVRLALIYAVLDGRDEIDLAHLEAALAVWSYCDESARLIFGDATGDAVADDILAALRRTPNGMTRTDISALFQRNRSAGQINAGLLLLLKHSLAKCEMQPTAGRPVELWFATGGHQ